YALARLRPVQHELRVQDFRHRMKIIARHQLPEALCKTAGFVKGRHGIPFISRKTACCASSTATASSGVTVKHPFQSGGRRAYLWQRDRRDSANRIEEAVMLGWAIAFFIIAL